MKRAVVITANPADRTIDCTLLGGPTVSAACIGPVPAAGAVVLVDELGRGSWVCTGQLDGNAAAGGAIARCVMGAAVTNTPGPVDVDSCTFSIPVYEGRLYRVTGQLGVQAVTATMCPALQVTDLSNVQVDLWVGQNLGATDFRTLHGQYLYPAAADGTLGLKMRLTRFTGAGNMTTFVDAARPDWFMVEDIGPNPA